MEIRQAILKAADHIEANPHLFDFGSLSVPEHDCGTPGCAIGWIGFFLGYRGAVLFHSIAVRIGLKGNDERGADGEFYIQMRAIDPKWRNDPVRCANALRDFADKYHPETPEQFPEIRRELDRIFDGVAA